MRSFTGVLDRLEVDRLHLCRSTEVPVLRRDRFDRLLVAQALHRGLTLVTPDTHIRGYPVAVKW
jgi:PIN domain nuclease of toxin-antitoxin system